MVLFPVIYKTLVHDVPSNPMQLFSSVVYTLPLFFVLHIVRKHWIYVLLLTLLMITSCIETIQVITTGEYILTGNLFAIAGTTIDEARGFIHGIISVIPWILPVVLSYIGCLFLWPKSTEYRICYDLAGLCSSVFLSIFLLVYLFIGKWGGNFTINYYLQRTILSRPPVNFFYQLSHIPEQIMEKKNIKFAQNMTFKASRLDNELHESYVLFVGESLRYASLSLGGYERETTPLLESLDNLLLFSDYYSTASLTRYSVPQIVTRATADNYSLNYSEKSIFKPFQECGFKTFVISSDNLMSQEMYLSDGCDEVFELTTEDDGKFSAIVDSLTNLYPKTFFILNAWGNHEPYINFPEQFDRYHPNPVSDNVKWDNQQAKINAYDNTVLYTDFVVYNIIAALNKPFMQSGLIMVSDHGADYELGPGVNDHGFNCSPHENEYHVPFIVWCSDTWLNNHSDKWKNAIKHKNMKINADNVFYSVCDMADISLERCYSKDDWSVFNDTLSFHPRRFLVPDGKNTIVLD